tara:strand:- start:320 stop:1090 length:771 start_codon:yes stop_codon:yes gene_type:complete
MSKSNRKNKLTKAQKRAQRMGLPIPVVAKAKRKVPTKKSKTASTLTFRIIEISDTTFEVGIPSNPNHTVNGQEGGVQFIRQIRSNGHIIKALENKDTNVLVGDANLTLKNFICHPETIFFMDGKTAQHGMPNSTYTDRLTSTLCSYADEFGYYEGNVNFWKLLQMMCEAIKANPNAQGESIGAQAKKCTRTAHSNHGCFGKNYGVRIDRGNGWEEFANWPTASEAVKVSQGSLRGLIGRAPKANSKYFGWKVERMN